MSQSTVKAKPGSRRGYVLAFGAIVVAASLLLAACGNDDDGGSGSGGGELIFLELPFPCDLNDYASNLCDGAEENVPEGYEVQTKTGLDYADAPAFNSLIQTSLQLDPAGLIVFPNGEAAQVPVLNQACEAGIEVIFIDAEPTSGVSCRSSRISAPDEQLGVESAKWLIAHPPANGSKEVAVVSQQPGQFASNDARVDGFTKAVEDAGFKVVTTVVTTNDLEETRSKVTNTLTAHPDLGAIFSANGPMGDGTSQALKGKEQIVHVTTDGNVNEVENILEGTADENTAFSSYEIGKLAVEYIVDAIEGKEVPRTAFAPLKVVDEANAQEYIDAGGFR